MKVERWEDETDEDWAERLAEEIEIANNTETTKYFVERDPYEEDGIIIYYIGEDGWTWKEHPEGPFKASQIIDWKNKAEKWEDPDTIQVVANGIKYNALIKSHHRLMNKLEAVKLVVKAWGEERDDGSLEYDWYYKEKYFRLRDILKSSEFIEKGDKIE